MFLQKKNFLWHQLFAVKFKTQEVETRLLTQGCLGRSAKSTVRVKVNVSVKLNQCMADVSFKYVSSWNIEIFSFLSLFTIVVGTAPTIERREWTASEKSSWLFSFEIVWKGLLSKLGYMQNSWENIGCQNNFLWYFQKLAALYFVLCITILWDIFRTAEK